MTSTRDLRVTSIQRLPLPRDLRAELPLGPIREALVERSRADVAAVLRGDDPRLLVVVGPCSVHDPIAALDYAQRLAIEAARHPELLVVMRVYFEKPRSTGGWKGLINDPHLDGSHDGEAGLRIARKLLLDILDTGLAVGCEFLEPTTPQYIADAVSWGAIGARTTESQIHRQLASGLSMPVGFKNATDGDIQVAIDGCTVASKRQVFFGVDDDGYAAMVSTTGNDAAHIILRGGRGGPNFSTPQVEDAVAMLERAGQVPRLVIDASHANSGKSEVRQIGVVRELAAQVAAGKSNGTNPIAGIMIESFLESGRQELPDAAPARSRDAAPDVPLVYGKSVTDACIGWDDTADLLAVLAAASRSRRAIPSLA
ncbi:MAG: 3-deoxy-7-phosphoheptulonate synthase [Glaciihabitans sp.]|nr:3-deoxy-7-phosphoheptulonate synthase [Glaciihabitans sp.]